MDWKQFISELAAANGEPVSYRAPVHDITLRGIEKQFRFRLPQDYRELMSQTDGVFDEYDCAVIDDVSSVRFVNNEVRGDSHKGFMPLDHLFFISSAYGNGDLIGYGIRPDGWEHPALYRWDHENDSRTWEAPDLKTWFEWRYGRKDET